MKRISIFLGCLFILMGCFPDERNNFMVPDSFGLSSQDVLREATIHTGQLTLGIVKSGKGQSAATVKINLESDDIKAAVEAYNKINDKEYTALPAYLYTLSDFEFHFSEKEVSKEFTISWDPSLVAKYIADSDDYVIPVIIESTDETVKVNDARSAVFVHLTRSSVRLSQTGFNRIVDTKTVLPGKDGVQPPLQESITLDVIIDNPIKGMAITYPVKVDNDLIDNYNAEKGGTYTAAPEGLVNIETPSVTIPEGGKSATVKLTIDYSVLLKDGDLPEFPSYAIPVAIDAEGASTLYNGKEFDLKGLSYGNTVTYITVDWQEVLKGIRIKREWGKFSTELASWNEYFGGIANADRNFTMDDEFIYVPETSEENATIWKISITDPEACAKVASPASPTGFFKMSAARVMDPGTDKMNGGKPMLIASNMVMEDGGPLLKLYIYDKGTDSAPTEWSMNDTGMGRRLGDIFTIHGTFKDGGFMFKDWDKVWGNGTILVWRTAFESVPNYNQTPRNPVWNTIKEEGGRAAFYPYPGQATPQNGIYAGPESAYFVSENGNNVYTWNNSSFDATDAGENYYGAYDFNFFEFHDKRHIAYVQNIASTDGRLWVLEGDATDSWEDILTAKRDVIFQASLQQDLQFSDGDVHEELAEPSPKSSGNHGAGCSARVIGDYVYIMAGKQNVGLSVFKMEYTD
ncbi:MAG: DUF1735 domain-containing protein [Bacteroidales bacterium]|nr:DUF1735 domain-containing protein [Bacteroidales bacterium]